MLKVAAIVSVLVLSGCAGSATVSKTDQAVADDPVVGRELINEEFDPWALGGLENPIKPRRTEVEKSEEKGSEQTVEQQEEQTVFGYRIQILQTRDPEEARTAQSDAIIALDAEVYSIFDSPYYKVRVGDFTSRYDAELFLESVIRKGYKGAWIVRTRINPPADQNPNVPENQD